MIFKVVNWHLLGKPDGTEQLEWDSVVLLKYKFTLVWDQDLKVWWQEWYLQTNELEFSISLDKNNNDMCINNWSGTN